MGFFSRRPSFQLGETSYRVRKVRAARAIFAGAEEIHEIEIKFELEDGSIATFQLPAVKAAQLISQVAVAYEAILPQNPIRVSGIGRASAQWGE